MLAHVVANHLFGRGAISTVVLNSLFRNDELGADRMRFRLSFVNYGSPGPVLFFSLRELGLSLHCFRLVRSVSKVLPSLHSFAARVGLLLQGA